jgi:Uncharacterized protein conserved in bacteria (DUF2064)
MSTDAESRRSPAAAVRKRRLAVVLARHDAVGGAPPGIDPAAFAAACLADTYDVVSGLTEVESGIAGPATIGDLLWPGDRWWPADITVRDLAAEVSGDIDQLVVVPADTPDLPALVLAKVFKALQRADIVIAPEHAGGGWVAIGLVLPVAGWIPASTLDLDSMAATQLQEAAPRRNRWAVAPEWHRIRTPVSVHQLDPGLEGWEQTRALLSGAPLTTPDW